MYWHKIGLIYSPAQEFDWMHSHASNPIVEHLGEQCFRIYFSTRDKTNRSSIGFIEIDITSPHKILNISDRPVLKPGKIGLFDDSGASIGCIVKNKVQSYLYYTGWNLSITVPWRNSIGLAIGQAGDAYSYQKYTRAPIIDRSDIDPYSTSYPWVLRDQHKWKMWYGSNLDWGMRHQDMKHVIKYAESDDGIHWHRTGHVAIPLQYTQGEWGVSKPCVLKDGNTYKMWYSIRKDSYRIGYAESEDGINWERMDQQVGIDISESGWDAKMIEYPHVFDYNGQRYMLYNGNGYGQTGFGLAVLESE